MADRLCEFCKGPHPVSDAVAEESPFCAACLPERVALRQRTSEGKRVAVKGITIDDQFTRDIDDAIWVEELDGGFEVHVSIADVSKTVEVGSELDQAARTRTGTQYFRTGNSPMLPRHLAEEKLSLWPDRQKKTLTVKLSIGPDLVVQDVAVFRSALRSARRLSYDQIPTILGDEKHPCCTMLRVAKKLTDGLLTKRRANGAMVLYDLNNGWVTTEEGHIRQLLQRGDTVGYIIIQELMILANSAVAQWAISEKIPILFRNHEGKEVSPDRAELLKQIEDALHTPLADLAFLRQKTHLLLERAKYEGAVKGHYGLNLPAYTHFTSPIRRYADLITHQQIRAHLKGLPLPYTTETLHEVGTYINDRVLEIGRAREERAKMKAEEKAHWSLEARRMDGLIPKEFERLTKVQVRSGEDANPNFAIAFHDRLSKNDVPVICLAIIMAQAPDMEQWTGIKHMIIQHLAEAPERAISLHAIAHTTFGWPALEYEVSSEGPSHMPSFTAKAKMLFDPPVVGPAFTGATSKIAKQCATVHLFAQMCKSWLPEFKLAAPSAPAQPAKSKPKIAFDKQPISALMEWCQAMKLGTPEFAFLQEGPPHLPKITCTVKVAGITKNGQAHSKQDAKSLAAAAAIGVLSRAG